MLQTIDTNRLGSSRIRQIAMTLLAILFTPAYMSAQDDDNSASLNSSLAGVETEIRAAAKYEVYCWNCSRSLNHAATVASLPEAFEVAKEQAKHSRNVRVVVGNPESAWQVLGRSANDEQEVELLVFEQVEERRWILKASMQDAKYASLIYDAIVANEGTAQIVMRFN